MRHFQLRLRFRISRVWSLRLWSLGLNLGLGFILGLGLGLLLTELGDRVRIMLAVILVKFRIMVRGLWLSGPYC